jgi:signal transduction histidine kinase
MRALKEMAEGTTAMTRFKCRFICRRPVLLKDVTAATQLYRIAQEAVNNALKHSGGKTIRILMSYRAPRIELRVEDDGVGFTGSGGDDTGMGLRVMKYRAEMIGATLEARPAPRQGLSIMCSLWKAL